jgi:hypothetical protein
MHSNDVRRWIEAYESSQRQAEKGRQELERLGLITPYAEDFESDSGLDGQRSRERNACEAPSRSRSGQTATRLALLVGAVMIATLAIFFG